MSLHFVSSHLSKKQTVAGKITTETTLTCTFHEIFNNYILLCVVQDLGKRFHGEFNRPMATEWYPVNLRQLKGKYK